MVSSYQVDFIIAGVLSLVILTIAGYSIFVPENLKSKYNYKRVKEAEVSEILSYLALAIFIFMLMNFQTAVSNFLGLSPCRNYDHYMLMMEGNKVGYLQSLATPILTYFSGIIYLLGFSFLLIFTFIIFMCSRTQNLKEYAIAFAFIYLAAYPFYIFFPVDVTGHVLPGVVPLLYQLNPSVLPIVTFCDPGLNNCFPSLHAALSMMATLFIVFRTDLKRYKIFAVVTTIFIQFSILYLGIHWIADLIAGDFLAVFAYFLATKKFKLRFKNEDIDFHTR
jgi:membrane-associated phospholipid phosphatase